MKRNLNNQINIEEKYYAKGSFFKRLIKIPILPFSWFAPHSKLRVFFHRLRGVRIGKNVEIGYFCIIGNVHPELITIGDDSVIAARTTILDHDNSYYYTGRGSVNYGPVRIGRRVFIGIGSVIMPNIEIGDRTIIGALSFVNKNIPANCIAAGIPAKVIINPAEYENK